MNKIFLAAGLFSFLVCTVQRTKAKDNTVPTLELKGKEVVGGAFYRRHFKVTGSTKKTLDKNADLITLQIFQSEQKEEKPTKYENTPVYTSNWWRTEVKGSGGNADQFEFYVNKMLDFGYTYRFKFAFYERQEITEENKKKIAIGMRDQMVSYIEEGKNTDLSSISDLVVKTLNKEVLNNNYSFVVISANGEIKTKKLDSKSVESLVRSLHPLANNYYDLKKVQNQTDSARKALNALKVDVEGFVRELIARNKAVTYKSGDITALLQSKTSPADYNDSAEKFQGLIDHSNDNLYGNSTLDSLEKLSNADPEIKQLAPTFNDQLKRVLEYHLKIKESTSKLDEDSLQKLLAFEKFDKAKLRKFRKFNTLELEKLRIKNEVVGADLKNADILFNQYQSGIFSFISNNDNLSLLEKEKENKGSLSKIEEEIISVVESDGQIFTAFNSFSTWNVAAPPNKDELKAIKIGTTFGGGAVVLNNDFSKTDAFSYVGLKFYFDNVDKRLLDPYLDKPKGFKGFPRAVSILVGFLAGGSPEYAGTQLQDAVGIKPVLGVSFDINRYLSFDTGTMLYKIESLSPLESSESLKASFFFGLSLDLDAFNRFKTLFNDDTYKLN